MFYYLCIPLADVLLLIHWSQCEELIKGLPFILPGDWFYSHVFKLGTNLSIKAKFKIDHIFMLTRMLAYIKPSKKYN